MQLITAFVTGLVFGLGLIVSGMTDPSKIIGFLDLAGRWDPSLAFVMAGAIMVGFFAFRIAGRSSQTLVGTPMCLPDARRIDKRLVLGGLVFGAGWGLAGYCPGPAMASLLSGGSKPLIFFAAMLAGMAVFELLERRDESARRKPA
ncbi:YeeE/YedE family protein [Noviherbaspirillum sp. ST9]|uniref:YeeE/YedE family protein n=1 Tax=Noviherbaspirillum sp. ST9 TaxID=3401606 RepID=UPI003B587C45